MGQSIKQRHKQLYLKNKHNKQYINKCHNKYHLNSGYASIIIVIFAITIIFSILIFLTLFLLIQTQNIVISNIKEDMYSINQTAIIALVKKEEKFDNNKIDKTKYEKYIKQILKKNYGLDNELKNGKGLIKSIKQITYKYEHTPKPMIKTIIKVEIKPVLFTKILKETAIITITENTKLEKIKT